MHNVNAKAFDNELINKERNITVKIPKYLINKLFLWTNFSKSSYLVKFIPFELDDELTLESFVLRL